jgi:hypothetical protein
LDLPLLGTVPLVPEISDYELNGRPLIELDADSSLCTTVAGLLEKIL